VKNSIALNGKGFKYQYNTKKVKDYEINVKDVIKVEIDTSIKFCVNNQLVATGDLSFFGNIGKCFVIAN